MLNNEQKQAVEYNQGPLLIVAGAGTGKTTVITEKIKYLIQKNLARPEEILALTFTEKAASEMEERVDKAIPYGYFQMWISTFHSFANDVLKQEVHHIGLNSGFRLMTEAETIIFLRQNLFLFDLNYFRPLGNPNKFLASLLQHFSRIKDEDVSPEEYDKYIKNQKSKIKNEEDKTELEKNVELAKAYHRYQTLKEKEGLMDFSDLIYYLLKLFRTRNNLLKKYRQQFHYVLIDEFQDTNIAQYELIKLLCLPKKNPFLTVVGDDSQAIYKFRGASVSNILTFMKDYSQAKQITLLKNYRSNQLILDTAYRLIKHNDPDTLEAKLGISKKLIANNQSLITSNQSPITLYLSQSVEEEADYVANEILKLSKFYRFSDFAILTRANAHSEPFIRSFARKGIPYQFLGPGMLLKQPEVKDLIAYLKTLADLEDSTSLYRVLAMNIFSLDEKDLSFLLSFGKRTNLSLFKSMEIYLSFYEKDYYQTDFSIYKNYLPFLKQETRKKLSLIFKMIVRHLSLIKKETAGQILFYFLEDSQYLPKLVNYKSEREEKIALNISKFFNKLKAYESEHEDASVFAVVDYLDMSLELGVSPIVSQTDISSYNAVNLLTVHSSKGLEFPLVFLVNLTRGRFPTYEKREIIPIPQPLIKEILPEGDYHQEEERRLFYVGITRAKDKVFFTASKFYGEGKREQKLSPFVNEAVGEEMIKKVASLKKEEKQQLSIFDYKKVPERIVKNKFILSNFSYSQLQSYQLCPLQYKYQYLLRVPTTPSAALSFGNTIHKTLQKFYQEFLQNKNIGAKEILEIYQQNWIPLGYVSSSHEIRMKKEGETILKTYLEKFHKKSVVTIDLEKLFKIKLTNDIYLTGKIDRVDRLANNQIEIIDYKTGKKPEGKKLKKDWQLTIYALAATDKGLYKKKLDQVKLTFYYLQAMEKVSLTKTSEDLKSAKADIEKVIAQIRTNGFNPKVGRWCDFCPYKIICEAWQ